MTSVYKILDSCDYQNVLDFYNNISDKILWLNSERSRQSSLQYYLKQEEYLSGCGKTNGNDLFHNKLSDIYKNSPLEKLITKFSMVRTRWMWIAPFSCYSIHQDVYARIHVPLITNKSCYFLFPDSSNPLFHLDTGNIYWTNTKLFHTFVNCSSEWRLHLVGSTTL